MNANIMYVITHNNCKISLLSIHVKIFTKFIPLRADNLSRLTGGSYDSNESVATVSDHMILFYKRVPPRRSAKLLSFNNLAT